MYERWREVSKIVRSLCLRFVSQILTELGIFFVLKKRKMAQILFFEEDKIKINK